MMNNLYILIGACFVSVLVYYGASHLIEENIEAEVALKVAQQNLHTQNEAIKKAAIEKEVLKKHNESQNERLNALEVKYSQFKASNNSCEARIAQLEALIKAFYNGK